MMLCRQDADLAWQLSVPIYHPTTTLVMVVYGEAGRGKITFLGKLHYRISHLMYLNHRCVCVGGTFCVRGWVFGVMGRRGGARSHSWGSCITGSAT
jgi:hypothetical protein